jgi:hypothetical protein
MTQIITGYLQSLGADIYHATAQSASHIAISALQSIVIIGVISGVGLIGYDFYLNRKKRPNVKELAEEIRNEEQREELDQIDRQNNQRNEGDDRYTPANT